MSGGLSAGPERLRAREVIAQPMRNRCATDAQPMRNRLQSRRAVFLRSACERISCSHGFIRASHIRQISAPHPAQRRQD
jgi:hypothetical protein